MYVVLVAWIYVLLLVAFMQVAVLGLQTSLGPAFFLPQRVRYSIQSDPQLTRLLSIDLSDDFLHVASSLIHRGMIIIRHYRIRKVARWVIVQFVWTQLIVRPRMHQANPFGEAHVRAHHIVLRRALIYLCVFLLRLLLDPVTRRADFFFGSYVIL